jgi:hypothetical protein
MNVANSVLWSTAIILKANKVNLFVSSVLFVFWYQSPNFLDIPRIVAEGDLSTEWSFRIFTMHIWAIQIHAAPTLFQVLRHIPYFILQITGENNKDHVVEITNIMH